MGLARKIEGLGDEVYFLTMARIGIVAQQFLERLVDEFVVGFFL
jgi:hypothetical protein